jgi:hypothetical protein
MKKHIRYIIILVIGGVIFSSCNKLLYTSLDVLRPAKVTFDINANKLLIVNNSVTQPVEMGHKTRLLNENQKTVLIATDSLAIFCLGAFAEEMEGKDFFSTVKLIPNTVNSSKDFEKIDYLYEEKVKRLCREYGSDVIVSLDKIIVNDDLNEYYFSETASFLSSFEVKLETFWSVRYLNGIDPLTVQFKDTLFWDSESYVRRKALAGLPKRTDVLIDAALSVGQNTVNRFVPYWEKTDRYFFNPSKKLMKQGMDSVYAKNWKSAIELWEQAYDKTKNNRIRAQAANNIAIAYEILGDINKAMEYAAVSFYSIGKLNLVDYESFLRISEYLVELDQRKKELELLKIQLGE